MKLLMAFTELIANLNEITSENLIEILKLSPSSVVEAVCSHCSEVEVEYLNEYVSISSNKE